MDTAPATDLRDEGSRAHALYGLGSMHPDTLWAASIGSPGSVTLLDPDRDWWVGIRALPQRFGITFDAAALARLRTLAASFEKAGVTVRFDLVPGVSHERMKVLPRVQDFLADVLAARRA